MILDSFGTQYQTICGLKFKTIDLVDIYEYMKVIVVLLLIEIKHSPNIDVMELNEY